METKQPPESVTDASDILAELSEQYMEEALGGYLYADTFPGSLDDVKHDIIHRLHLEETTITDAENHSVLLSELPPDLFLERLPCLELPPLDVKDAVADAIYDALEKDGSCLEDTAVPTEKPEYETAPYFTNNGNKIIDEAIRKYTKTSFDAETFPASYLPVIQRDIIRAFHLEEVRIPDASGFPIPLRYLPEKEFFKRLPEFVPDRNAVQEALQKKFILDAFRNYNYFPYLKQEEERRLDAFTARLRKDGLLEKPEPYLIFRTDPGHDDLLMPPAVWNAGNIVDALRWDHPDFTVTITRTGSLPYFEAVGGPHTAPESEHFQIIPQSWFREALRAPESGDRIRRAMDLTEAVRNVVYDAVPEFYQGQEEARALRDYVIDRIHPLRHHYTYDISPSPDNHEYVEGFARDILRFRPEELRELCRKDEFYHPGISDERLAGMQESDARHHSDYFTACRETIDAYMWKVSQDETEGRLFRPKDLAALTRLFESCTPQDIGKIGNFVKAISQDSSRRKALDALTASRKKGSCSAR